MSGTNDGTTTTQAIAWCDSSALVCEGLLDMKTSTGRLSFKKGDVIEIVEKIPDQKYWKGRIGQRCGTFPSDSVKLVELRHAEEDEGVDEDDDENKKGESEALVNNREQEAMLPSEKVTAHPRCVTEMCHDLHTTAVQKSSWYNAYPIPEKVPVVKPEKDVEASGGDPEDKDEAASTKKTYKECDYMKWNVEESSGEYKENEGDHDILRSLNAFAEDVEDRIDDDFESSRSTNDEVNGTLSASEPSRICLSSHRFDAATMEREPTDGTIKPNSPLDTVLQSWRADDSLMKACQGLHEAYVEGEKMHDACVSRATVSVEANIYEKIMSEEDSLDEDEEVIGDERDMREHESFDALPRGPIREVVETMLHEHAQNQKTMLERALRRLEKRREIDVERQLTLEIQSESMKESVRDAALLAASYVKSNLQQDIDLMTEKLKKLSDEADQIRRVVTSPEKSSETLHGRFASLYNSKRHEGVEKLKNNKSAIKRAFDESIEALSQLRDNELRERATSFADRSEEAVRKQDDVIADLRSKKRSESTDVESSYESQENAILEQAHIALGSHNSPKRVAALDEQIAKLEREKASELEEVARRYESKIRLVETQTNKFVDSMKECEVAATARILDRYSADAVKVETDFKEKVRFLESGYEGAIKSLHAALLKTQESEMRACKPKSSPSSLCTEFLPRESESDGADVSDRDIRSDDVSDDDGDGDGGGKIESAVSARCVNETESPPVSVSVSTTPTARGLDEPHSPSKIIVTRDKTVRSDQTSRTLSSSSSSSKFAVVDAAPSRDLEQSLARLMCDEYRPIAESSPITTSNRVVKDRSTNVSHLAFEFWRPSKDSRKLTSQTAHEKEKKIQTKEATPKREADRGTSVASPTLSSFAETKSAPLHEGRSREYAIQAEDVVAAKPRKLRDTGSTSHVGMALDSDRMRDVLEGGGYGPSEEMKNIELYTETEPISLASPGAEGRSNAELVRGEVKSPSPKKPASFWVWA